MFFNPTWQPEALVYYVANDLPGKSTKVSWFCPTAILIFFGLRNTGALAPLKDGASFFQSCRNRVETTAIAFPQLDRAGVMDRRELGLTLLRP